MAELERVSSAIAILVGFAGIGIVLHSGLASIAAAVDRRTASLEVSGAAPRVISGAQNSPPPFTPPASPPVDSAVVQRDRTLRYEALTLTALAPQRPAYASACFRIKEMLMPFWIRVELTFDAEGRETARELFPEPRTEQSFVDCLRKVKQPALKIEAPGQVTRVSARITIP